MIQLHDFRTKRNERKWRHARSLANTRVPYYSSTAYRTRVIAISLPCNARSPIIDFFFFFFLISIPKWSRSTRAFCAQVKTWARSSRECVFRPARSNGNDWRPVVFYAKFVITLVVIFAIFFLFSFFFPLFRRNGPAMPRSSYVMIEWSARGRRRYNYASLRA